MIFIIFLGSIFIENSYGVIISAQKSDPSLPEVSLQLILRDSDGRLVESVIEDDKVMLRLTEQGRQFATFFCDLDVTVW